MADRTAFLVLILWIAFAVVLLGAVPEAEMPGDGVLATFLNASGGYALFRALGWIALGLTLPAVLASPRASLGGLTGRRMLGLLGLLLLLGLFQLLPLPLGLMAVFAPAHARDLSILLPEASWHAITTDVGWTLAAIVRGALLAAAGLVVLRTVRSDRRAFTLLGAILAVASAGAAYGLVETHLLADGVLGFSKAVMGVLSGVTGTFIYRGNFAALAACGLGISGGLLVASFRNRKPLGAAGAAMALVVLAAALALSGSRAGLGAGGFALLVGVALSLRSWKARGVVLGLVALGGLVLVLSVSSLRERFFYFEGAGSGGFMDVRVPAWGSSLALFAGRPVFGAGLGAFRRGIHLTQSTWNADELYFAHSDPLNLLAEGGLVGFLLGAAVIVLGVIAVLRLARRIEGRIGGRIEGPGAACAGGLAGLLAMGCVDFPFQIPALALIGVTLLFIAPALERPAGEEPSPRRVPSKLAGIVAASATALLILFTVESYARSVEAPGALTEGELAAERGYRKLVDGDFEGAIPDLEESRRLQPFEGQGRFYLAYALLKADETERAVAELKAAHRCARGLADLNFRIGRVALADRELHPLAAEAFREAGALKPKYYPMALELVPIGMVPEVTPERGFAYARLAKWHKGRGELREAIAAWWRLTELDANAKRARELAAAYRELEMEEEGRAEFRRRGIDWP